MGLDSDGLLRLGVGLADVVEDVRVFVPFGLERRGTGPVFVEVEHDVQEAEEHFVADQDDLGLVLGQRVVVESLQEVAEGLLDVFGLVHGLCGLNARTQEVLDAGVVPQIRQVHRLAEIEHHQVVLLAVVSPRARSTPFPSNG